MKTSKDKHAENLLTENMALREQIRDFEKLSSVLKTICSTLDTDEILNRIINKALSLCQADEGAIILFDPEGDQIAKTLIRHGQQSNKTLDRYLNNLLSGWVLEHKKSLISSKLTETFKANLIKHRHRSISSTLSIPLELQGEIIGIINLITSNREKDFGKREAWLMETLASQCVHFIVNARLHEKLFVETRRLQQELQDKYSYHGILGHSPAMKEVFSLLEKIIPTDGRVIVEGESGTGKELIARVLHFAGSRRDNPFVAVDCGALPSNLLESELFGYVKGAFTGATQDKRGLFEEAHEGTLFLDEISNMPLEVQSKLLRSLEEEEIRPVGSTKVKKIDVRIIAAASRVLKTSVESGNFREDLFYRLNIVSIKLPPLRDRKEDIPLLAIHFLHKLSERYGKNIQGFKPETLTALELYHWPGNVRELENVIERSVILAEQETEYIPPDLLSPEIKAKVVSAKEPSPPGLEDIPSIPDSQSIKTKKAAFEKNMLWEALIKNKWNQSTAAKELGIHESTLRYKMEKFKIKKP